MVRPLLTIITYCVCQIVCGQQTIPHSFECQLNPGYQEFTAKDITTFICKSQFENFRLLDRRDTLTFDNGFVIVLFSANELQKAGLINNTDSYQSSFPPKYKLPVFHVNTEGQIAAAYPVSNEVKFSRRKE